jgi:hypothetical protein
MSKESIQKDPAEFDLGFMKTKKYLTGKIVSW